MGGSSRAEFQPSAIQTADLLNLSADESSDCSGASSRHHFDPFDNFSDPFAQAPFTKVASTPPVTFPPPPPAAGATPPLSGSHRVLSPPISSNKLKSSFTDTFSDSFGDSFGDSFVASGPITTLFIPGPPQMPSVLPPPKSPKVKSQASVDSASSISHYSTIRPRKKTNNESFDSGKSIVFSLPPASTVTASNLSLGPISIPPPLNKSPSLRQPASSGDKSPRPKLTSAIPRPSGSHSSSTSPRNLTTTDSFDCQPFVPSFSLDSEFQFATGQQAQQTASGLEKLDIFTELDPLGTGKSRPYVDKKDFFQDLKKPPKKKLLNQLSVAQLDDADDLTVNFNNTPLTSSAVNSTVKKQPESHGFVASNVKPPQPESHAAKNQPPESHGFSEDPFGSLHFVPAPEPDPFDTKFASFNSQLFVTSFTSAPTAPLSMKPSPTPPTAAPLSVSTSAGTIPATFSAIQPVPPPPSNHSGPVSSATIPSLASIGPAKQKSPHLPRHPLKVALPAVSQSDSDSELSTLTPRMTSSPDRRPVIDSPSQRHASVRSLTSASVETIQSSEGRRDSPRLALEISSSEEDSSSSEEASDRDPEVAAESTEVAMPPPQPPPRPPVLLPPPLPPKGQPPLLPQRPVVMTPEASDDMGGCNGNSPTPPLPIPIRKPKISSSAVAERMMRRPSHDEDHPVHPPTLPPTHPPPKTKKTNKLNQISLGQLSNMSLGELAATLQLPPARLACMTLTELALRLAELNEANESEERIRTCEPAAVIKTSDKKKRRPPVPEPDEEEEEEVEIKVDEAEVCYKGGKKYEILSNTQEQEAEAEDSGRLASHQIEPSAPASKEDKYAALREIMEQELGVVPSVETPVQESADTPKDDFADFDEGMASAMDPLPPGKESAASSLNDLFQGLSGAHIGTQRRQTATESPRTLGFDDDFSCTTVHRPASVSSRLDDRIEEAFSSTGARPKTPKTQSIGAFRTNGTSISSGSVDFDPFEDEFKSGANPAADPAGAWNGSSLDKFPDFGRMDEDDESRQPDSFQSAISADPPIKEEEEEEDVADEFADKFAAFEARFPANPLEGFGDSFTDIDISASTNKKGEPFADFDSAFGQKSTLSVDSANFKKSQSVNIFKRVDDPFDDDFFQDEETPGTTPAGSAPPGAAAAAAAAAKVFNAIVEDPFAWVQPFDDNYKFDDEFAS